jgi:hypothetical protein
VTWLLGVDDEALNLPDVPVGGMDGLAAAHADLSGGQGVVGDRRRVREPASAVPPHLVIAVRIRVVVLERRCHLGVAELPELRVCAAEPDLACRGVEINKVERGKPTLELAVVDHEMGDGPSARVHDQAAQFAADPIGTADVSPDRERRRSCHGRTPRLSGL